jgi:hydrogenase maturation protein HypF
MPGGDKVTKEPWRTALSLLFYAYPEGWFETRVPLLKNIDLDKAKKLTEAIDKGINSPLSCSTGRLFDAVAALTGICTESNYHAEAPQLLENYLTGSPVDPYPFVGGEVISFIPMIREIVANLEKDISLEMIISRFHTSIAEAALSQVLLARKHLDTDKVVLSGGSFQNRYLCEKLVHLLKEKCFTVYLPREVSCNDGGIALGQLAVAAHKKRE